MLTKKRALVTNQLRRYRRHRNLTLRQVAALAGMPAVAHLSHWEKGRKIPTLRNALKLSAIIQCPVEVLFFDLYDTIRKQVRSRQHKDKQNAHG